MCCNKWWLLNIKVSSNQVSAISRPLLSLVKKYPFVTYDLYNPLLRIIECKGYANDPSTTKPGQLTIRDSGLIIYFGDPPYPPPTMRYLGGKGPSC